MFHYNDNLQIGKGPLTKMVSCLNYPSVKFDTAQHWPSIGKNIVEDRLLLIIWEGIGFMWKITFQIFIKSRRYENPWKKKFNFPAKMRETRKKCWEQIFLSQEDIQIYYRPFFDQTRGFCFNRERGYQK